MTTTSTTASVGKIFLRPRPYATGSGVLILLPLISEVPRKPWPTLPAETWFRIFSFVFASPPAAVSSGERKARLNLLLVSKTFKNLVSPLLYTYPYFSNPQTLKSFTLVLRAADQTWDSLRRIPYSTPGRWVQTLDLSRVSCMTSAERLAVDTLLTFLFSLTPFLAQLVLNNTVKLSKRAITALASSEGIRHLRILKGVKWDSHPALYEPKNDPLLALIRASENLEEFELFGPGLQDDEDNAPISYLHTPPPTPLPPLLLPNLHSLMILSVPKSPLLESLIHSSLPSLRHLMVTPYDDVPSALTSSLIAVHGPKLHTLAFHTPKMWPPIRHATPPDLLHTSPSLQALSLTTPLPSLIGPTSCHPLRVLSIPRPDSACLWKLEAWLYLGLLQSLEEVHMRDTRWIRPGVSHRASEAGVQGEMKEWKRRLARWRVRVLDVHGKEDAF